MAAGRRYRLSPLSIRETTTGAVIVSATVTVYLAGTSTLATCYADTTTATALASSQTTTNANGYFEVFIDSKDYSSINRFKIVISKTGYSNVTYDNLLVLPDLSGLTDPWVDLRGFLPVGYVTDGSVDYSTQIQAAADYAVSAGVPLFLPAGTWGFNTKIRTGAEIFGVSPLKSILYNRGTGDGLDLGPASYYSKYEKFQVKGNATSQDGITLYTTAGDNPAYMQFDKVYTTYNGRHGLYHRNAWGTKYSGCKAHYNSGIGLYLITISGDAGTHNGVSFLQCESRWNGGTAAGTTYASAKGGVSINGATCVAFVGGVYESNNAWQFLFGQNTDQSLQVVKIDGAYIEGRPTGSATVGGAFYFNRGGKISIENCEIGFGAGSGYTSYAFYVDGSSVGTITERNNQYSGGGAGTSLYINSGAKLSRKLEPVVTIQMGDTAGGGSPVTQTLVTASDDGQYKISGVIYCGRNSEQGGAFPFIATRYLSTRSVAVGSAIVGTATTAPTMAWSGNNLQITWGAYHIGHVEFSYTQAAMPTTFTLNSTYLQRNDEIANLPF